MISRRLLNQFMAMHIFSKSNQKAICSSFWNLVKDLCLPQLWQISCSCEKVVPLGKRNLGLLWVDDHSTGSLWRLALQNTVLPSLLYPPQMIRLAEQVVFIPILHIKKVIFRKLEMPMVRSSRCLRFCSVGYCLSTKWQFTL